MLKIILGNSKSRIIGDRREIAKLIEKTKIRKPGAFFSNAYGNGWDGYIRYVSEATGLFQTGLVEQMCKAMENLNIEYEVEDGREVFKDMKFFGVMDNGDEIRGYQKDGALAILDNRFKGIRFQRGILDYATNAGKSYIMACILGSYSKKRNGLVLIDNTEIFDQLYEDLKTLLGKENVGCISSKKTDIKRINLCMVQTLGLRLRKDLKLRAIVTKTDIVIVDECDTTASKKVGKTILGYACNATVRVGLSGTPLLHKDKTKNQEILAYFGPVVAKISNKELVGLSVSTKPVITMITGNREISQNDYATEYRLGITMNRKRNKRVWKRVLKHEAKDRLPLLIVIKYKDHAKQLMDTCPKEFKDKYRVDWVHSERKDRKAIIEKFKTGKLDVLITSMIIQRGKNLPLTKVLINAAGGDSHRAILQIFGRLLRSHASKTKVYLDDLYDYGRYLKRHSKHRTIFYKNEGFGIKEIYKK